MTDGATTTTTTAAQPWHHGVDTGVMAAWTNKGYDLTNPLATATTMWEQYRNLESHMGVPAERLIRMPRDAADEAAIKTMRQKLGVPDEAAGYDFNGIKFGDGAELETSFVDSMRGALHRAGVSKDNAPEIVKAVIKYLDEADAAEKTVNTSRLAEQKGNLQKSWGNRHDENMLAAKQGARRLGVDAETVAALENTVGYDKVMEMFRKIGAGTSEDTFHEGRNPGSPATQQGAAARLAELQRDEAWVKRLFAGDVTTRKEFDALNEQVSGYVA